MDAARKATEKRLRKMETKLHKMYTRAQSEVGTTWKKYMEESGKEIADLQKQYDAAKKADDTAQKRKLGRELQAKKKEVTIYDDHYKRLTADLANELTSIDKRAAAYINGELPEVYAANYNAVASDVMGGTGYSFELVDAHTVQGLATKDKTLLPYKKINEKKVERWNTRAVNSEVTQGILQGESMDKIAARLQKVTKAEEKVAIRNARTAVTSAENRGRMDMMRDAEARGIEAVRIWIAANDDRTRDAHAELDGQEAKIDEPFENSIGKIMYPGDPSADPANVYNCRCTLGYRVIGFVGSSGKHVSVGADYEEAQT